MVVDPQQSWEDEWARQHMIHSPTHCMTIDIDDQWHCLTCEDEAKQEEPFLWGPCTPC